MSETTDSAWSLPTETASMLRAAYATYREQVTPRAPKEARQDALTDLGLLAQAGREKGWSYHDLADACEISAERLRQIVNSLDPDLEIPAHYVEAYPEHLRSWELPDRAADLLRAAHGAYTSDPTDENLTAVALTLTAGRERGWSYASMATALDVTPDTLRTLLTQASPLVDKDEDLPEQLLSVFPETTRTTRKSRRKTGLTPAEIRELQELAALARQTNGSTPLNSPIRHATKKFSRLIIKYHTAGVTWGELSQATGLSEGGVRSRAMRHGHGGPWSTIPTYRGTTIYQEAKRRKRETKRRKREARAAAA